LSGLMTTGSANWVNVNIYNPSGVNVGGPICYTSNPGGDCRISLWNLAAGTYSVVVTVPYSNMTMSFNAILQPDTMGPTLTDNNPTTVNLGAGQVERLTFNANQGDTMALNLSGVSTTSPTGQLVYVNVYRPDTGAITTGNYYTQFSTSSSITLNLPNLPVSGTYTVVVYTNNGTPATAQLMVLPGVAGTLSEGVNQSYATSEPNQDIYTSFTANQGDNLELTLSGLTTTGSANWVNVNIYNANGVNVNLGNTTCSTSNPGGSCRMALWNLAAGTYSVVVSMPYGNMTASFTATLEPDTVGTAIAEGSPAAVNLGLGQVERFTFNANLGDSVALNLSSVSTTLPSGQAVYVNVYRPDTGAITTSNAYTNFGASGSNTINLSNLPASGTYTAVVYTPYGTPATAQLALIPPNNLSTLSTTGTVSNFTATAASQNVMMTFGAVAGANLELTLSNVNASGASTNGFEVFVTDPNGTQVANFYCYASSPGSSCTQPLWNLIAGTYSISAVPVFGGIISFSAQLSPDLIGPALSAGAATNISLSEGQAERVTFSANQGSNIVLQLAGVSTTPANQAIYVDVYEPGVGEITTTDAYASFEATGSNSLNLTNLPASGTYTAVIRTGTGIPASAQLSYATQ